MSYSTMRTAAISLLAGCLGSALPHFFLLPVVHAQTEKTIPSPDTDGRGLRVVRAEQFVLVDAYGGVRAELKVEKGLGQMIFYGAAGQILWKGPVGPHLVH